MPVMLTDIWICAVSKHQNLFQARMLINVAKIHEIDNNKYMEFMESTLDQITSSLGIDFDEILGKPKQTGIEDFFY